MTTPRLGIFGAMTVFLTGLSACVNEGPSRAPVDRPPPAGMAPSMISLLVTADFRDTDGNNLRDTALAYVYIFGNDPGYAASISAAGSATFILHAVSGEEICRWTFDAEATAAARAESPLGPRYEFLLDLRAVGKEAMTHRQAALACVFHPKGGDPIATREAVNVSVGRAR